MGNVIEGFHAHAVVGEGEVADGFAEENFVADGAGGGHGKNILRIGLHDDAGDAEVDQRLGFAETLFDLYLFGVGGWRHRVRHIDDRGDAAANGRRRAGSKIFLMSHARLSKMDVTVEKTRQNMFTFDVDLLFALGKRVVGADGDDDFIADRHATLKSRIGCDDPAVLKSAAMFSVLSLCVFFNELLASFSVRESLAVV